MTAARLKIRWFAPQMGARETVNVRRVIESEYLNDGGVTREFERAIAKRVGVKFAVGVPNGTSAITLALMAAGVGPGDEVLVPDLTFIATANAVRLAGASVRLVDVTPDRFVMDVEKARRSIGRKTRAIVPVDVNGRGADYKAILALARAHGLSVICDAAEALGSRWGGRMLGAWGDAGCFSFSPNKTVTTGQGGMVVTNSERLYHRLLELKDQGRRHQGTGGDDKHPVMGFNFKLTNLQAAVGLAQLEKLDERLKKAAQRERWYREALADLPRVRFPALEKGEITQWTDVLIDGREKAIGAFKKQGIGYRSLWFPLHTQKPYRRSGFPTASWISARGLWLPSTFDLTRRDVETVARVMARALR